VSQDEQALCFDRVRQCRDPVAAVIGARNSGLEALDLIDVDYEILATISDPKKLWRPPSQGFTNTVKKQYS